MKLSISIAILVFLGLVTAVSAAVLVAFISARPLASIPEAVQTASGEVSVLVAADALPAMRVIDADMLETVTMPRNEAPSGHFSEPTAIIGKMLSVPAVKGQALTRDMLPPGGAGYQLAGLLESGKRAISISIADYAALEGLLYPGSVVDVLASFTLSQSELGSAVSTTLLEGVQVLAVENIAVTTQVVADGESPSGLDSRRLRVTLMVDTKQAEALQLAMEFGTLNLTLRNPRDDSPIERDATLLNQGQLARLAEIMETRMRRNEELSALAQALTPEPEPVVEEPEPAPAPPPAPRAPEPDPALQVDVLRGTHTETLTFPVRSASRS